MIGVRTGVRLFVGKLGTVGKYRLFNQIYNDGQSLGTCNVGTVGENVCVCVFFFFFVGKLYINLYFYVYVIFGPLQC